MKSQKTKITDTNVGKLKIVKLPRKVAVFDKISEMKMVVGGKKRLETLRNACIEALKDFE